MTSGSVITEMMLIPAGCGPGSLVGGRSQGVHRDGVAGVNENGFRETWADSLLVVENVPVVACPNCGESYMTAETL